MRIQFRDVPGDIFNPGAIQRNELVIRVQPGEAVYMKMMTKKPGMSVDCEESELDLTYNSRYQVDRESPTQYNTLFHLNQFLKERVHYMRSPSWTSPTIAATRYIEKVLCNNNDNDDNKSIFERRGRK